MKCDRMNFKKTFIPNLNNSFGSGGMAISLNDSQFSSFIQFLKRQTKNISIKTATSYVGQQPCGKVWVMGPTVHLNEDGDMIEESLRRYVWIESNDDEDMCIPSTELIPTISFLLSSSVLKCIINLLRVTLKHNFPNALLILAGGVMALHYQTVTKLCKGCPAVVAIGPPETGKSTALAAALAISGTKIMCKLVCLIGSEPEHAPNKARCRKRFCMYTCLCVIILMRTQNNISNGHQHHVRS